MNSAVLPVLDVFLDILNNKFLPAVAPEVYFDYDNPVNADRDQEVNEAKALKNAGILTVNEARAILNYPEIEGGDQRETQNSPLGELENNLRASDKKNAIRRQKDKEKVQEILKARPTQQKKFKAIKDLSKHIYNQKVQREQNSLLRSEDARQEYLKAVDEKKDGYASQFKQELDVYREGLMERIIEKQEELGMTPDNIMDTAQEIGRATKIFQPLMRQQFKSAGQSSMEEIANGLKSQKASEQFNAPEQLLEKLDRRAEFFTSSMLETDFEKLKEIIVNSMEEGEGIPQLANRIEGYFEDVSKDRARTIARTETSRLVSQATQESYRQSAVVTGKEWISSKDDRVRPEHQENDGQIVGPDEKFQNGERYPGDNSINCRCALAPAV